jgi:hypothetical protein
MHAVEVTAERAGGTARIDMNTAERASVSCAACTLSRPRRSARAALELLCMDSVPGTVRSTEIFSSLVLLIAIAAMRSTKELTLKC